MRLKSDSISPAGNREYWIAVGRKDIELMLGLAISAKHYIPHTEDTRDTRQRLRSMITALTDAKKVAEKYGDEGYRLPFADRLADHKAKVAEDGEQDEETKLLDIAKKHAHYGHGGIGEQTCTSFDAQELEMFFEDIDKLMAESRKKTDLSGRIVGMHELEFALKFDDLPLTVEQTDKKREYVNRLEDKLANAKDTA